MVSDSVVMESPPATSDRTTVRGKLVRQLRVARSRASLNAVSFRVEVEAARVVEAAALKQLEAARSKRVDAERRAAVSAMLGDRAINNIELTLRRTAPAAIAECRTWLNLASEKSRTGGFHTEGTYTAGQLKARAIAAARDRLTALDLIALTGDELAAELAALRESVEQAGVVVDEV